MTPWRFKGATPLERRKNLRSRPIQTKVEGCYFAGAAGDADGVGEGEAAGAGVALPAFAGAAGADAAAAAA